MRDQAPELARIEVRDGAERGLFSLEYADGFCGSVFSPTEILPRSLRGVTALVRDDTRWPELARVLPVGSRVTISTGGEVRALTIPTRGDGVLTLLPRAAWGVDNREDIAREELAELGAELAEVGERWGHSAATIAGRTLRATTPQLRQLRPRWRGLAWSALHVGPMEVHRATAPGPGLVVCLDQRAAYLRALERARVPVPGSWRVCRSDRWADVRALLSEAGGGFVTARVWVDPSWSELPLPPLPVGTRDGYRLWARGELVGSWWGPWLAHLVTLGLVQVRHVYGAALCRVGRLYGRFADTVGGWPKRLKKLVYTRAVGLMMSRGAIDRRKESQEQDSLGTWSELPPREPHQLAPTYRPDHAAVITWRAWQALWERTTTIPQPDVMAMHLDCIWYRADTTPVCSDEWAVKDTVDAGDARFFGVGMAFLGKRTLHQGMSAEKMRMNPPIRTTTETMVARRWVGGVGPAESEKAASSARILENVGFKVAPMGWPDDRNWTPKGWVL